LELVHIEKMIRATLHKKDDLNSVSDSGHIG